VKVFVSHADADKQIALPFVDLLKNGIGITHVFCSSSKGAIRNGQSFVQSILSELLAAECTISLLSPNYLKSQFCIAELGSAVVAQFKDLALFNSFIIPPTRFGDLGGMLIGVQSEPLEEIAALNGLCSRLGGNPAEAAWIAARDAFYIVIKPIADRRKAEELLSKLIIHDFRTHPTNDPKITYQSKIRVQLKNNTGQSIEVSNPSWTADPADVPLQVPQHNFNVLQLESNPGWHTSTWAKEAATIAVPPGAVFRLWFGLHQAFPADDLRRRHEGQLLGTLTLQVRISGIDLTWRKRL
jgi:TIR domain